MVANWTPSSPRCTADGRAEPFRHGVVTHSVATLTFFEDIDPADGLRPADLPKLTIPEGGYELLSEDDLEELFNFKEDEPNEKKH